MLKICGLSYLFTINGEGRDDTCLLDIENEGTP